MLVSMMAAMAALNPMMAVEPMATVRVPVRYTLPTRIVREMEALRPGAVSAKTGNGAFVASFNRTDVKLPGDWKATADNAAMVVTLTCPEADTYRMKQAVHLMDAWRPTQRVEVRVRHVAYDQAGRARELAPIVCLADVEANVPQTLELRQGAAQMSVDLAVRRNCAGKMSVSTVWSASDPDAGIQAGGVRSGKMVAAGFRGVLCGVTSSADPAVCSALQRHETVRQARSCQLWYLEVGLSRWSVAPREMRTALR